MVNIAVFLEFSLSLSPLPLWTEHQGLPVRPTNLLNFQSALSISTANALTQLLALYHVDHYTFANSTCLFFSTISTTMNTTPDSNHSFILYADPNKMITFQLYLAIEMQLFKTASTFLSYYGIVGLFNFPINFYENDYDIYLLRILSKFYFTPKWVLDYLFV